MLTLTLLRVRAWDANALACACARWGCKCFWACAFGALMFFRVRAIPPSLVQSECYYLARARVLC